MTEQRNTDQRHRLAELLATARDLIVEHSRLAEQAFVHDKDLGKVVAYLDLAYEGLTAARSLIWHVCTEHGTAATADPGA